MLCSVLKHVAASAAEAELGGLFTNARIGLIMRLTLHEMGHPQPPTTLYTYNTTGRYLTLLAAVNGCQSGVPTHPRSSRGAMDLKRYLGESFSCT